MTDPAGVERRAPASGGRRSVVLYIFNTCRHDIRVLDEAASLVAAGYSVTIVATLEPGVAREEWHAGARIVRLPGRSRRTGGWRALTRYLGLAAWAWRVLRAGLRADVHHAQDLTTLPLAWLAARRSGRWARLVYDSREIFLEANRVALMSPRWRRAIAAFEGWLLARSDAVVTVNQALATELQRRYRRADPPVVVMNCRRRWHPEALDPPAFDRFRQVLPIGPERRILLYQGGFSLHRGLEQIAEALLAPGLEAAVAVYLGYGPLRPLLEGLASHPHYAGRLFVVDAVSPEELLEWTASADVSLLPLQRSTLNHWLATPNKLFESLAAGVPVVASRFPEIERIVETWEVGTLVEPTDVAGLARATAEILALGPEAYLALRRRCRRAALERYNWETESARLLEMYERIVA